MSHVAYLIQETAPAEEPVTLAEAKLYLRVEHSDEDSLINRLITAARRKAENYTRRSFVTQSWKIAYDEYVPSKLELPRGNVQSITSVKTITRDGSETTLSTDSYYLTSGNKYLAFDAQPLAHRIEIVYAAGYGGASAVPAMLKQGMLTHIARMFEERDMGLDLPVSAQALYDDYKVVRL